MTLAVLTAILSGCGGEEPAPLETRISGLEWVTFQGMSVPQGDQGPSSPDFVAPTGYDRNPAGAALAAMSATVRMSVANDEQWTAVSQLLAPGAARDTWAVNRSQVSITEPVRSDQAPTIVGYSVPEYSADRAEVRIYTRQHDGSLSENRTHVVWLSDGWLLELRDRKTRNSVAAVSELPGDVIAVEEKP